jgi:hypothetical protein
MEKFGGIVRVGFSYRRCVGPRYNAAGVSVSLSTHEVYQFLNEADWPSEDCGRAVERGVRDGLAEAGFDPDLGVQVVLRGVEWDPVHSSEHSFYLAAKCAAKSCVDYMETGRAV